VWPVDWNESGERPTHDAAFALHDAKNMAAVLKANLDYLSEALARVPKSASAAAALRDATESSQRLGELLREALVALQGRPRQRTEPAALRVAPVIASLVDRIAPMATARGVRVLVGGADDAYACIDLGLFERAILNFLDNALRFSKPGDTIEIEYMSYGGRAVVAVADEGPGVPEFMREAIFASDRRERGAGLLGGSGEAATDAANGGAESHFGLGLAFCREVARAHGGNAWVFNRVSGGACFVLEMTALS
jgi:two-component system sensor histidine kinase CreC